MEDEKKVTKIETEKIVVDRSDELIDILNKIEGSKASKIILTFTEATDILISPINLKVILDIADDNKKILVAQIIQNPSGIRNAKDAGMVVTEATGTILDDYWFEAEKGFKARMKYKDEKLFSKKGNSRKEEKEEKAPKEDAVKELAEEALPIIADVQPASKSDFENFVDQVLQKSQDDMSKKPGKIVEKGGVVLALDSDIDQPEGATNPDGTKVNGADTFPIPNFQSLIGHDMGAFKKPPEDEEGDKGGKNQATKKRKKMNGFVNPLPAFFSKFKGGNKNKEKGTNKGKANGVGMLLLKIFVPLILFLGVVGFLIYELTPTVRVTIFVQSKKITLEKDFSGVAGTQTFSYDDGLIPVKREDIKKDSSGNTTPTGVAFRGNKAIGIVQFWYYGYFTDGYHPATIPAGTIITAGDGLQFRTNTVVTVGSGTPPGAVTYTSGDVGVTAIDLGSNYNEAANQNFSVTGYDPSKMVAKNTEAFSGGTKEQYTVLSKDDVSKVVDTLKKSAFDDTLSELQAKTDGGWELIQSTLKQTLVGDPKTDIPVGGEGSVANITITTDSTALYYQRSNIDDQIADVLSKAAQEQNLFNNDNGLTLKLSDDIQKTITVTSVKNDTVKIHLAASGTITPDVNKDTITKELQGKNWTDGQNALKKYNYSDQATTIDFSPSYFPDFLKYFPALQGRIILVIQDI